MSLWPFQAGAQVSNTPVPILLKNTIIIKVFHLDLKANNTDQELFGVRGLNEAEEATLALWELCCAMAAH